MAGLLSLSLLALVAIYLFHTLRAWRKNYLAAKATGLPYILIPVQPHALQVRIFGPVLFPLFKKLLPASWTDPWLPHIQVLSVWYDGISVFRQLGCDAYYLVAPGGLILLTCSPEAITEIQHRHEDFPRPIEMFRAIGAFGPNLAVSDGDEWRMQRRLVSRAFGDRTNREVWTETLFQAAAMVTGWAAARDKEEGTAAVCVNADSMKMSLHIISKAGFGHRIEWDNQAKASAKGGEAEEKERGSSGNKYGMSYVEASRGLVNNVLLVIGVPGILLRYAPFSSLRKIHKYDAAFKAYLFETIAWGRDPENKHKGNDILSALARGAEESTDGEPSALSDAALMGNSFLFVVGGHETTASSMMMAIMYLALKPDAQRRMQADIDQVVGDRQPEEWSYDQDLPRLREGMVGAVMNEELRIAAPIPSVVKLTTSPQHIKFDGIDTVIPPDTIIALNTLGAHRNAKYWPHGPPTDPEDPWNAKSNLDNDLEEFKPERWYAASADEQPPKDTDKLEKHTFRPRKGVYFPFSEGPRACIGRKFAQIEYAAVLAVVFKHYSIELDVRKWASDAEVDQMSREERKRVWHQAGQKVRESFFKDMDLLITMHLKAGTEFPIRLVPRGQERFASL